MSVRIKLFGLVAFVALVPVVAFAWTALSTHQSAYDQALRDLQQQHAAQASARTRAYLSGLTQNLGRLATSTIKWGDLNKHECQGAVWLLYRQAPEVVAVSLVDAHGKIVGNSAYETSKKKADGHPVASKKLLAAHEAYARTNRSERGFGKPFRVSDDTETFLPLTFQVRGAEGALWTTTLTLATAQLCAINPAAKGGKNRVLDADGRSVCDELSGVGYAPPERPALARVGGRPVVRAGAALDHGWHVITEQPASALLEPRRRMLGQTALWIILSAGGAMLGGVYLARAISSPVDTLVQAATEIGRGNYDHRVELPERDEYGRLASAINEMGQEIALRDDKIRGFNARLQRKVSEKADELQQAHERLLQTQKLAATATLGKGVAQEVNNPLTSVLGIVQLLRERLDGDPSRVRERELLTSAEGEARRIRDIVKRLLGVSQRQDNTQFKAFSAADLVSATIPLIEPEAEERRVDVEHRLHTDSRVKGNFAQLQQALLEVLDNAVAYSPPGAVLQVSVLLKGASVVLTVRDGGAGMDDVTLGRAREPFFTTRADDGAKGLGLAIANRIVEDHEGKLEIFSTVGQGTSVRITLPRADTARGAGNA